MINIIHFILDKVEIQIIGSLLYLESDFCFSSKYLNWIYFIEIDDGAEGYCLSEPKEHEAGYDAYITGLSFLGMWKYLGKYTFHLFK